MSSQVAGHCAVHDASSKYRAMKMIARASMRICTSFPLPLKRLMIGYAMMPAATPWAMLKVRGITRMVMKAGTASVTSSHWMRVTDDTISTPTTINAGVVANKGMASISGVRKRVSRKRMATMTLAKPVRAPSDMPDALSI